MATQVLVVCLGNICRSPAAQGVLEHLIEQNGLDIEVNSAGTAAYHIGKAPDSRSISCLAEIGIDISNQRARQVNSSDFELFDWILAMDAENLKNLKSLAPKNCRAKVVLFGRANPDCDLGEVADPYYGDQQGFVDMREHLLLLSQQFLTHFI